MLDPNDPRLTAYALGELDASDCRTIEDALAKSPELRLVVEEIRRAARLVNDALLREPAPELASHQPALKTTVAPAEPAQPLARRDWLLPATIASVPGN